MSRLQWDTAEHDAIDIDQLNNELNYIAQLSAQPPAGITSETPSWDLQQNNQRAILRTAR